MNPLQQDCQQLVDDCITREGRMTDWERTFIEDISGRLDANYWLTEKQKETLGNIWDKVTEDG